MKYALAIALVFAASSAQAKDAPAWEYASPDLKAYYASLKQPDHPGSSCCGEAGAYYADEVAECEPADGINCALVTIITDTRDDKSRNRPKIEVGTRIAVPPNKIRKHPVPNPTDHNIIFVNANRHVWCWEPQSGL